MSSPSSNPRPTFFSMEILSIGIDYTSVEIPGFPRLKWAAKDARTMAALMATNGYRATLLVDDELSLPDQKPTSTAIMKALEEILRRRPHRLIVFIAAHGVTRVVGNGGLLAVPEFFLMACPDKDGQPRVLIPLSDLVSKIQESGSYDGTAIPDEDPSVRLPLPAVLFVIDACRNLEDARSQSRKSPRSKDPAQGARNLVRAIQQPFCDLPNFEVIFATPEGNTTHESDALKQGCATYALIRAFQDHPQGLSARQWAFHANAHYPRALDSSAPQGAPIRHAFEGALTYDSFTVVYPQHLLGRLAREYREAMDRAASSPDSTVDAPASCPACEARRHRIVSLEAEVENLKGHLESLRIQAERLFKIPLEPAQPSWPAWLPPLNRWFATRPPGPGLLWIDVGVGEILPQLESTRARGSDKRGEVVQAIEDLADLDARLARTPLPEGSSAGSGNPVRIAREEDFVHIAPSVVDSKHQYLLAVDKSDGRASREFLVSTARDRTPQALVKRTPGFQFRQYRVMFVVRT